MVLYDNEATTMPKCLNACKVLLQPTVDLGEWGNPWGSKNIINPCTARPPCIDLMTWALFGCSRICINPYVLGWIGVELKLNSTPIHPNTCGLR